MCLQGDVISTPSIKGTILPGITRKSIIDVARSQGFQVLVFKFVGCGKMGGFYLLSCLLVIQLALILFSHLVSRKIVTVLFYSTYCTTFLKLKYVFEKLDLLNAV